MTLDSKARKIFKKFPKEVKNYFLEIDQKCQKYGVTFRISGGYAVNSGCGRCGGYFDDHERVLVVAIGSNLESAMSLLVHESTHMERQWKNPKSIWKDRKTYNGYNRFFRHLEGRKIYKINTAIRAAVDLEMECEKMAIKEIKKRWLKYIDVEKYSRQSFAYLASFQHMAKIRKWPVISPSHRKFLAHCPNKLPRTMRKIPRNLQEAFDRFLR